MVYPSIKYQGPSSYRSRVHEVLRTDGWIDYPRMDGRTDSQRQTKMPSSTSTKLGYKKGIGRDGKSPNQRQLAPSKTILVVLYVLQDRTKLLGSFQKGKNYLIAAFQKMGSGVQSHLRETKILFYSNRYSIQSCLHFCIPYLHNRDGITGKSSNISF